MKAIFTVRHLIQASVVLLVAVALTSCNTIRGAGRDMQKVGNKIERAAER